METIIVIEELKQLIRELAQEKYQVERNGMAKAALNFVDIIENQANGVEKRDSNCNIPLVSASLLPDMEMEEAEVLSMQCDYACFAIETNENEINTADASAFFLEGYLEAQRRLKSNEC